MTTPLDKRLPFATNNAQIRAIDDWRLRQAYVPTRSEAVRLMIDATLRREGIVPPERQSRRKDK